MSKPRVDPRDRTNVTDPTWRGVLVAYAMMAAAPALVWTLSHPLLGAVAVAVAGVLYVAARRVLELRRCHRNCGGLALDVTDDVEVCVARPNANC